MRTLLTKILTIIGIMLLLLIPISQITNTVSERENFKSKVIRDIAKHSSESQTLTGPILVVPYSKEEKTQKYNKQDELVTLKTTKSGNLYFLPDTLNITSELTTEERYRGIYSARLYHSNNQIDATYKLPAHYGITENLNDYQFSPPYLAIGISDVRGIESIPTITLNEKKLDILPGSKLKYLEEGIHAKVDHLYSDQPQALTLALPLKLQGTSRFSVTPIGRETSVSMTSDWPHPSFNGQFLPNSPEINNDGFIANWRTSYFSTNYKETFNNCIQNLTSKSCVDFSDINFGVSLLEPIDFYVKTNRAIKYAILFIVLTFTGFFLFEIMKNLQVHPIQYALVGLSLATFYLLLLSLSEHISFAKSYLIAATACILLISCYLVTVLGNLRRSLGFSSMLTLLYAMLYGIISAEDYALLMGTILLFVILGGVMLLTRHLDWYVISAEMSEKLSSDKTQETDKTVSQS